jgi:hypothetical protein
MLDSDPCTTMISEVPVPSCTRRSITVADDLFIGNFLSTSLPQVELYQVASMERSVYGRSGRNWEKSFRMSSTCTRRNPFGSQRVQEIEHPLTPLGKTRYPQGILSYPVMVSVAL